MKITLLFFLTLVFVEASDVFKLNEGFNQLERDKKEFHLKKEHFTKELQKEKNTINELIVKNQKILEDIAIKEANAKKQYEKLDNLYNNLYNKQQKKIISFYSQMKPGIIADIFSKLVIEDIEKAIFIIQNIPEKQAIATMMKMDSNVNSLLTQKLLKRKENGKR